MRRLRGGAVIFLALCVQGAGLAQTIKRPPAFVNDPNKIICRTQTMTGSRLMQSRKCLTRAQWTQLNREERATIDKIQRFYLDCKLTEMAC